MPIFSLTRTAHPAHVAQKALPGNATLRQRFTADTTASALIGKSLWEKPPLLLDDKRATPRKFFQRCLKQPRVLSIMLAIEFAITPEQTGLQTTMNKEGSLTPPYLWPDGSIVLFPAIIRFALYLGGGVLSPGTESQEFRFCR
jgi:hypothetical protein